jgi:hypothetical protein
MQCFSPKWKASIGATLCAGGVALAGIAFAGPENIRYPSGYAGWQRYSTVERADLKQTREMYAHPHIVKAVREGKPVPDGAVLVMAIHAAKTGADGTPEKDAEGRFVKDRLVNVFVMEKRAGWGADYPAEWRNGDWEYAAFLPEGKPNEKANAGIQSCFACHKPKDVQDYVFSMPALAGRP